MKYPAFLTIFCLVIGASAFAQQPGADTLTYAQGKIINHTTKEPINASISYQSLPYGNIVGMLKGANYRFPMYENERYEITVEAPGFAPAKYMLDPAAAKDRIVTQDVELGMPGSASTVAETAHTVGKVMNLDALIFEQGKAKIDPTSFEELDKVAAMLKSYPAMVVQLEGHTDVRGDAKALMKLSQDRVDAVKDYLVNKGVTAKKVKTKAFGGTQPLSRENTEDAHKMNRRVQVRILEN